MGERLESAWRVFSANVDRRRYRNLREAFFAGYHASGVTPERLEHLEETARILRLRLHTKSFADERALTNEEREWLARERAFAAEPDPKGGDRG